MFIISVLFFFFLNVKLINYHKAKHYQIEESKLPYLRFPFQIIIRNKQKNNSINQIYRINAWLKYCLYTHAQKKKINVFYLSNQGVLSGRSMVQKG